MSTPVKTEGCTLNPLKYELNCKTTTAATIVTAITAIVALAGFLAILTSQGFNLGPLNALSNVGMIGGSVLAGVGGIVLLATVAWIIAKVVEHCRKKGAEETKPEKPVKESKEKQILARLAQVFVEKGNSSVAGKITYVISGESESTAAKLYYTAETKLKHVIQKIARDNGVEDSQITLYASSSKIELDPNTKWAEIAEENITVQIDTL